MDPVMFALLFGFFGICIVWTIGKNLASRWEKTGEEGSPGAEAPEEEEDVPQEVTDAVYRRIGYLRIASFVLCLLAVAALYFQLHRIVPLCLAGVALVLQWQAHRKRTEYLRRRRLVPQGRR